MTNQVTQNFRILEWDSSAFGFAVARIEVLDHPVSQLPVAHLGLRKDRVTLAYWETPLGDPDCRRVADDCGGYLVNSRVLFETALGSAPAHHFFQILSEPNGIQLEALEKLALASGWMSRFALDPNFPNQLFEKLYREWWANSLNGQIADAILVSGEGDVIDGMVTVSARAGRGQIGLFGVDAAARGKGVGKKLLKDALDWFAINGCSTAAVVTQGENEAAMALYRSCGFTISRHDDVFHFWNHYS
jgi:dTDP-4-amino-4,6-dideoxy-D-galactose acyltransferase